MKPSRRGHPCSHRQRPGAPSSGADSRTSNGLSGHQVQEESRGGVSGNAPTLPVERQDQPAPRPVHCLARSGGLCGSPQAPILRDWAALPRGQGGSDHLLSGSCLPALAINNRSVASGPKPRSELRDRNPPLRFQILYELQIAEVSQVDPVNPAMPTGLAGMPRNFTTPFPTHSRRLRREQQL